MISLTASISRPDEIFGIDKGRMRAASGVRDVLGREAGAFDDWARDNAAALK
jgi:hypothetical protein